MSDPNTEGSRIGRLWRAWVRLWDVREVPWSLALVRIGLVLCLMWDLSWIALGDLVVPLWGPASAGGWGDPVGRSNPPLIWQYLPDTADAAWIIWGSLMGLLVCIGVGIFPRVTVLAFVLLYAQTAQIMDDADRGIDTLMRNVLLVLWLSPAWNVLSVGARWRTGSFLGDGTPAPTWARRLIILQLVIMYWGAGITKTGLGWMPWGGSTALYYILHDPAVARFDYGRALDLFYPLMQLSTFVTIVWEHGYPLLLVVYLGHHLKGRFGDFCRQWRPELMWISIGALFHVLIAVSLNLGIFPFAMLSLYPAFATQADWDRWLGKRAG